ncbi:MAG: hypothetical protein ACM3KE_10090 [Hyphomicrobiales bacterium]
MTEQLSLFQTPDSPPAEGPEQTGFSLAETDASALDELFRLSRGWRHSCGYLELLEFITRFPAYSPLNGLLIHLQNPDATQVATARTWSQKYQRRVKSGARPIAILAPMSPVRFVFDLRDTEGPALPPEAFKGSATTNRLAPKIYDTTLHNCAVQHITVREAPASNASAERTVQVTPATRKKHPELRLEPNTRYLVLIEAGLTVEEKYAGLVLELGHIFCGHLGIDSDAWWVDRKDLELECIDMEAASVAHLICGRRRLARAGGRFLAECREKDRELPFFSLNSVFQAATHIEAMGKAEWSRPRKHGRY